MKGITRIFQPAIYLFVLLFTLLAEGANKTEPDNMIIDLDVFRQKQHNKTLSTGQVFIWPPEDKWRPSFSSSHPLQNFQLDDINPQDLYLLIRALNHLGLGEWITHLEQFINYLPQTVPVPNNDNENPANSDGDAPPSESQPPDHLQVPSQPPRAEASFTSDGNTPDENLQQSPSHSAANERLRVLNKLSEQEQQLLMTQVINNHPLFHPLSEQLLTLIAQTDFMNPAFYHQQMLNTLLYTYINRPDQFSEQAFMAMQFWAQLLMQLSPEGQRPVGTDQFPTDSIEVIPYQLEQFSAAYRTRHGRILAHMASHISSIPAEFHQIIRIRFPAEQRGSFFHARPNRNFLLPSDPNIQFSWLHYAQDLGYLDIPDAPLGQPITVLIPFYPIYQSMLDQSARIRNIPPTRAAPRYGQNSENSLFRLRQDGQHPVSLWHHWITGSITIPDNTYAGIWLGFIHDLVHIHCLNSWPETSRSYVYELYERVGLDIDQWLNGQASLPNEFLVQLDQWLSNHQYLTSDGIPVTAALIRQQSYPNNAGYDFELIDLPITCLNRGVAMDMARLMGQHVLHSVSRGMRLDLLLAKHYAMYLMSQPVSVHRRVAGIDFSKEWHQQIFPTWLEVAESGSWQVWSLASFWLPELTAMGVVAGDFD